jgi:hypothetical protein
MDKKAILNHHGVFEVVMKSAPVLQEGSDSLEKEE